MATKFYESFVGPLVYPWVNKPDTKFNAEGVFKTGLRGSGALAEKMATDIEAAAQVALEEHTKAMTPKLKKEWTIHLPFARETDDNDVPTGFIVFDFKQNATLTIKKTQEKKSIKIGLYDSAGKEMHAPVYGGSEGRVRYSMRAVPMVSLKKVGIRLDFAAVQVSKLASGNAGGGGFGKIEGGYSEDADHGGGGFSQVEQPATGDTGGDY